MHFGIMSRRMGMGPFGEGGNGRALQGKRGFLYKLDFLLRQQRRVPYTNDALR